MDAHSAHGQPPPTGQHASKRALTMAARVGEEHQSHQSHVGGTHKRRRVVAPDALEIHEQSAAAGRGLDALDGIEEVGEDAADGDAGGERAGGEGDGGGAGVRGHAPLQLHAGMGKGVGGAPRGSAAGSGACLPRPGAGAGTGTAAGAVGDAASAVHGACVKPALTAVGATVRGRSRNPAPCTLHPAPYTLRD